MSVQTINNGLRSISLVSLRENDPTDPTARRPFVFNPPENVVFSQGITEELIKTFGEDGIKAISDSYVTEREGTLALTTKAKTPETLSLFTGLKLRNGTKETGYSKNIQVTRNLYPAVVAGRDGFGVTPDQAASYATYLSPRGISTPLTRVAFAGHNLATPDTFSQGADGAIQFANNVVAAKYWVHFYIPYINTDANYLSEETYAGFHGDFFGTLINGERIHLIFPNLLLNPSENGEIDFSGGELQINFRVAVSGDSCQTFQMLFLDRLIAC